VDANGYSEPSQLTSVWIDTVVPSGSITVPARGALVREAGQWSGTASDNWSPRTFVGLQRVSDGAWWSGTGWEVEKQWKTANPTFGTWNGWSASPVAAGTVLPDGAYRAHLRVTDSAGNAFETTETSATPFTIDGSAPIVTWGTPSPAPNARGWNNTPVNIPFTVEDAGSGVASVSGPSPLVLSVEGKPSTGSVTVRDRSGNAQTVLFNRNIDRTPPKTTSTVTLLSGQRTSNGTYTGSLRVALAATDTLSGVLGTYYKLDGGQPQPYTAPVTIEGEGDHTLEFWSVDNADNAEAPQVLEASIDSSAPVTTLALGGTQGDDGWYTSAVTVSRT
jgi:hypothetical protein